ncbi:hypothetical protein BVRB_6g133140 [Beta vulgaris subsp. vulgaris]|nr:hypothetical protein BVRB_6g133140 [Beta vulgaris subsp. vulgaris]
MYYLILIITCKWRRLDSSQFWHELSYLYASFILPLV